MSSQTKPKNKKPWIKVLFIRFTLITVSYLFERILPQHTDYVGESCACKQQSETLQYESLTLWISESTDNLCSKQSYYMPAS